MRPLCKFNRPLWEVPRASRSPGFSLLEITVAIMILSIMVTLLWTTLGQSLDVQERSRAIDERQLEVRNALDRIAREISMAFIVPNKDPNPSSISLNQRNAFVGKDNNDRDRLDFTAFAHLKVLQDAKESDQAEISYYTEIKGGQIHLFRRESPLIDDDPQAGGKSYVLLENISKFNLTYNDLKRGQWTRDWDTRTIYYRDRLPAQVEIFIEYFNAQGNLEVLSTRTLIYAMDALQW